MVLIPDMNNLDKLKLLMWKYSHFRQHYWILTLCELCLPILIVYVAIRIGSKKINISEIPAIPGMSRGEFEKFEHLNMIFYTPPLAKYSIIMDFVYREFRKDSPKRRVKIEPVNSEKEMVLRISKVKDDINTTGIVFLESSRVLFRYKIRDKNVYNTSEMFYPNENELIGPTQEQITYYRTSGFISLMAILNRWYIEEVIRPRIDPLGSDHEAILVSFPYPAHVKVSPSRALFPLVLGYVIVITSLILYSVLLFVVVSEKANGLQELMKIVGVPEKLLWFSWFLNALAIGLIVYTIVVFFLKYDILGTDVIVFRVVNGFIIWICLMLYCIAQTAFCFMFCAMFNSVIVGTTSLCMTTMTVSYLAYKVHEWHNLTFVHLSCFIPVGAFIQGFIRFAYYDTLGVPLSFGSLFSNELNTRDASVGFVLLLLFLDTFLYLFLTYYISAINPDRFGSGKSPFFLFQKASKKKSSAREDTEFSDATANSFVEPLSTNTEVSIVLKDLRKNFGHLHAVKRVNLTLRKNEIVILLGYNGAGKTTTLSMMTGLIQPTSGQILFKGTVDLLRSINEFRKNLGVCFQEDRLFPYMTVRNHLLFFGMLKGATEDEAAEEAEEYLQLMDLKLHSDDVITTISKGMKRKLNLAIALMGKADVLILDEPTAGLNVPMKQKIWNLLLKLRETRTIILTSQSMKEAERLADRIAIMNHGLIVADGSVPFLKKTFGTGYHLKLLRKKEFAINPKEKNVAPQITDMITKTIPGSRVESRSALELIFSLPSSETARFPALLRGLESKKATLGIERLIVSGSTLEHVYFKLGRDSIHESSRKLRKLNFGPEAHFESKRLKEKVVGLKLEILQHKTLLMKKFLYLYRNPLTFVFRVVVPTILMMLLIQGTRRLDKIDPPLELTLNVAYPNAVVIISKNDNTHWDLYRTYLNYLMVMNARMKISNKADIHDALLDYANASMTSYRRDVVLGNEFFFTTKSPHFRAFYNEWACHSLPVLLNAIDVVLLWYKYQNESLNIIPINHPIKRINVTKIEDKFDTNISEHAPILTVWFILLAFFTIDLLYYFMTPVKVERIDGFKQIQLLSSVSPRTYWINNFLFDLLAFFTIVLVRILLYKSFDYYGFFIFRYHMLILILMIVLFIASGLLFMYVISFAISSKSGSYSLFFLINLVCTFVSFMFYKFQTALFSGSPTSSVGHVILTVAKYTILLVPPLNFSLALEKFIMNWRVNHLVEAYAQLGLEKKIYSTGDKYLSYLEYASAEHPNGILLELQFLVADIALYAIILYAIERGFIVKFIDSQRSSVSETPDSAAVSEDVQEERNKVDELSQLVQADNTTKNVLLALGLKKIFGGLWRPSVTAVADATFVVNAGQCFGLLGPNGAGKTTIFKMLTGEITPTQGESWILNMKLSENKNEYFEKAGYCAETNCFLGELTGKETLRIIASLRGVHPYDCEPTVRKWLAVLGLEPIENKKCGQYSEGDQRKICTALALIGDPNVVILDEPTSGIDPISRQRLYNVLNQTKLTGQAIALATRSMEECEALCDRFTILVEGKMKFIGTTEDLKKKYARSYSLMITLHEPAADESKDIRSEQMELLKKLVAGKFKPDSCVLQEESKTLLRYKINDTLPLADTFQKMEDLKKDHKIIEEYLLTETSLDEVFHSFLQK